ncbi:hypothetical protein PRZ48_004878 [Zasmidium cellare]|uniref:Major facilitator superfamily (MFS) profile domain-containing protein n=1 Tax=Zasmidium cellare TaxID=395010 RepID=A0ABR0ESY6_ZASCE|nr:hypothetical protein PRZ48_004878 [Zasmidium cellare]
MSPADHEGRVSFSLLGAARGFDEGLIGTTASQKSFSNLFHLKDPKLSKSEQANRLSNITSMVQIGCVLGAMVAFFMADRLGRLWAARQLIFWWVAGLAIFISAGANGSLGQVYAGRFIAGVGIGQTAVVGPAYLAEIAPYPVRGLVVGFFAGASYLGIMIGYFASYGSSLHISNTSQAQWIVPNSTPLYVAAIIFVLSWFQPESPRWLVKKGRIEDARHALATIRQLPEDDLYIAREIADVTEQLEQEQEATMGTSKFGIVRELFMIPSNRYRLWLSFGAQVLSQWSGAGSITVYAPQFFAIVGVKGSSEGLLSTAVLGIVKFVSSLISAILLVDMAGRKPALCAGITIQLVAMTYMALFLTIDPSVGTAGAVQSASQKHASTGAIAMIYFSGFGWALGWNSLQYLINAEIYPLRLRALGSSIAMTLHFANQYGSNKAITEEFLALTTGGTMWFFAAVTLLGLVWVWFFLPEATGRSLEEVDALFELPWYKIGRQKRTLPVSRGVYGEYVADEKEPKPQSHVEDADVKA